MNCAWGSLHKFSVSLLWFTVILLWRNVTKYIRWEPTMWQALYSSAILLIITTTWKISPSLVKENEEQGSPAICPRTYQSGLGQGFLIPPLSCVWSVFPVVPHPPVPSNYRLATFLLTSENERERLTKNWLLVTVHLQVNLCICAIKCWTQICLLSWLLWLENKLGPELKTAWETALVQEPLSTRWIYRARVKLCWKTENLGLERWDLF